MLILVPAAGASSRMRGADKLTRPVAGEPLLTRQVRRALATGAPVLVTLPAPDHPREAMLAPLACDRLRLQVLPDAATGFSRSLVAGAEAARRAGTDLMVLLPDMPDIETADIAAVHAAHGPGAVTRAAAEDGTPGHPVLFDRSLMPDFAGLQGDEGAARILRDREVGLVRLAGRRALRDLDTPEDWDAYLAEG